MRPHVSITQLQQWSTYVERCFVYNPLPAELFWSKAKYTIFSSINISVCSPTSDFKKK